jgi:MFS family permease
MIPNKTFIPSQGKMLTLTTFFFLYIAQSIPMTFLYTAIQVIMRQADYSLTQIALLQIVKLPWILKFLWAPMVDRHCIGMRDYRRFIFLSESVYAALILLVGFLRIETDLYLILLLVFIALIASATQDIATDALAARSFSKTNKSLVNAMQSMGSFGGTLIGSGVLLVVLHRYGWNVVLILLCLFVVLAVIPLALNRQLQIPPKSQTERAHPADFLLFFTQKRIWKQIGFLVLYYAGIIGTLSVLRPWMVDLGYDMNTIGVMSMVGTGAAFAVSFPVGLLIRRIGLRLARLAFALLTVATTAYFVFLTLITPTMLLLCIGIILLWCCYSSSSVVVYTTAMNCVRQGREGTDFTVQTVITHFSGLLVALLSGYMGDLLGFTGLFVFETWLALFSVGYILICYKKE